MSDKEIPRTLRRCELRQGQGYTLVWHLNSVGPIIMPLTSLDEDVVILVCLELTLSDIISIRQVCRFLCNATRTKAVWINILEPKNPEEGNLLPPYLKRYDLLDAVALEALVRRVSRLAHRWEAQDLSVVRSHCLFLPQSITWLRLVHGTWLLVTSSDSCSSKITCWDLSLLFQGYTEPLAEAYLSGPVKTGKLEVQDSGIVLALGLGAECPFVHIITLRQHLGRHVFCELCRIEDSSHVLMLCGNFVGCASRHGAMTPHLINWKETRVYDVPPPPGGLDIPGRRSVPHLMTIWSDSLVIIRKNTLEIYDFSSNTWDSVVFVKLIRTPTIWEAVVCNSVSTSLSHDTPPPLRLLAISPVGIELCVVEHQLAKLNDDPDAVYPSFCLARHHMPKDPWYRLCIGETGRRCLWLSTTEKREAPHFVYTNIPVQPTDTEMPRISWNNGQPDQLALWGIPVIDFDESLGLTVIGNCFGELAIYDHDGRYPERCGGLAMDFTDRQSAVPPLLPSMPLSIGLATHSMAASEPDPSVISQWSQDTLTLDKRWSKDWLSPYPGYWNWDGWLGVPCDFAWLLEHAYGFPGPVIPQAFADDLDYSCQHLLFRSGRRYFVFTLESDQQLRSWPLTPAIRHFHVPNAQPESYIHRTALTVCSVYRAMFSEETQALEWGQVPRNRWIEQGNREAPGSSQKGWSRPY
ncbi:hypothetical protein B0H19DRAFT_1120121 [Mycena capillaripes]|nr:hypothetical protein B0H19DRAFT_1120121 [Mycena capillaripes]